MEYFQRLDENIADLVIGHGFLNLDTLQFATDEEVENAATLALQVAGPDVQLAIAIQQSGISGGRRAPPNLDEIPGDPIPRQYITWEGRNRLLADSRPNSASTSESDEAKENNEQNCIPEMRRWRRSRRAYRHGPQEGARAWPTFEIQPDDPLCNHHLPMSWVAEDMNNREEPPQCGFCRSRDEAIYFRCRTCGMR
ncbi:hypothetical protein CSHISOI_04006 [Colletotrichum shisoi]|uniref:IBR domain-containing protein n=1 Tax=Colletotrichum shisoi TaxID=2078593 RepID=A0A5Q4BWA8_9PEZI|nr:hypothetical protein CSHISOI_04006 [Colletotrichum shisoi]